MSNKISPSVTLSISDQSQFAPLHDFLTFTTQAVGVSVSSQAPKSGEQGAYDMLVLAAGGSGVLTAIRTIPEFLKARRTGIAITATVKGKPFTLTSTNVDEVMPILERILDD